MKVFQAMHKYIPYIPYFEKKYDVGSMSFEEHRKTLIEDRFYALHFLQPCLEMKGKGFYTMWDYEALQHKWAREKGWQEMDLKQKINHPYYYPVDPIEDRSNLFDVIRDGLLIEGSMVAYSTGPVGDEDEFTIPLSPDSIRTILNPIERIDEWDEFGEKIGFKEIVTPIESEFFGTVTLEFSNTTPLPAKIYANEGVAQFLFLLGHHSPDTSFSVRKGNFIT